jgi:hypothetical protein
MDMHPRQGRWRRVSLRASIVAAGVLVRPVRLAAQGKSPPPIVFRDSARAAVAACAIVGALHPAAERYPCHVEGVRETATEYIVRVREDVPPNRLRVEFERSEIRLPKAGGTVTVTRQPVL